MGNLNKECRPFSPSNHISFGDDRFLFLNDDNPILAYQNKSKVSFVAQPLGGEDVNRERNVIPVPLMMTDEWEIIQDDRSIIERLREIPKTFDYNFVGQCHYAGREVLRNPPIENYDFEENPKGIYGLNKEEKRKELISFLERTAKSKFVFCPRGAGSSSFRLYQSLMVGSVPIITGMNDYPFSDKVDWNSFSIRGSLDNINELVEKSKSADFESYAQAGMKFWDEYCVHDNLYRKLEEMI